MVRRLAIASLLLAACAAEPSGPDVCEQAAEHRAACLGDYVTPPICDDATAAQAEVILEMGCDEMSGEDGKADGAFCDWFGAGCTADEPIFDGCSAPQCGGVSTPEFAASMDRWTESRETAGSASHLLVDNVETRELRHAMIAGAQRSIHFTALILEPDDTGYAEAALLADAARRGVEVKVVVDATTQYTFGDYDILETLADAGVEVLPFNPILEWAGDRGDFGINANQRLHEKLLIVDDVEAIVGGRNVGDDYLQDDKWRDTCVHLAGAGVADVQRMFVSIWNQIADWERRAGCPQADKFGFVCPADLPATVPAGAALGPARTRPVYSDPRTQSTPYGYRATLNLVRGARESIYIANSYFVPPRRLRKHLKEAVARGVRVVVVTNSLQSTDAWWMYYASLNYYKELIGAGVEVRHYRGTETMHAKTMLVDGEVALVGSFNLDPRSAKSNSEAMVLIRDGEAVSELADAFAADVAYSDLADDDLTAAEWLKAKTFRIVEPLL